jgi:hypothetical protein
MSKLKKFLYLTPPPAGRAEELFRGEVGTDDGSVGDGGSRELLLLVVKPVDTETPSRVMRCC